MTEGGGFPYARRYSDPDGTLHGFIKDGDKLTSLDVPDSTFTVASGINNLGQIVGFYNPRPAPQVPEPDTIVLLGVCGVLAVWLTRRWSYRLR